MTAHEACQVAAKVIREKCPYATVQEAPLTDGGEGFADILTSQLGGEMIAVNVTGPRQEEQPARYGIVDCERLPEAARKQLDAPAQGTIAVIEMAQASGLQSLADELRDPWQTTPFGTGQLIVHAADKGVSMILLGVGGSATNDLGVGALQAIGLEANDGAGESIEVAIPSHWEHLARFGGEPWPHIPPIRIACDVANPLLGPNGATAVYGPQKGLRKEDFNALEKQAGAIAKKLCSHFDKPRKLMAEPGAGAAGGIAFGLLVGCDAQLVQGFELVSAWLQLDEKLDQAGLVITGEGRFDASSLQGKGPGTVVKGALESGKEVWILAGSVEASVRDQLPKATIKSITPEDMPLSEALPKGSQLLAQTLSQLF